MDGVQNWVKLYGKNNMHTDKSGSVSLNLDGK